MAKKFAVVGGGEKKPVGEYKIDTKSPLSGDTTREGVPVEIMAQAVRGSKERLEEERAEHRAKSGADRKKAQRKKTVAAKDKYQNTKESINPISTVFGYTEDGQYVSYMYDNVVGEWMNADTLEVVDGETVEMVAARKAPKKSGAAKNHAKENTSNTNKQIYSNTVSSHSSSPVSSHQIPSVPVQPVSGITVPGHIIDGITVSSVSTATDGVTATSTTDGITATDGITVDPKNLDENSYETDHRKPAKGISQSAGLPPSDLIIRKSKYNMTKSQNHPHGKLTPAQRIACCTDYYMQAKTVKQLSSEYGVSGSRIYQILNSEKGLKIKEDTDKLYYDHLKARVFSRADKLGDLYCDVLDLALDPKRQNMSSLPQLATVMGIIVDKFVKVEEAAQKKSAAHKQAEEASAEPETSIFDQFVAQLQAANTMKKDN